MKRINKIRNVSEIKEEDKPVVFEVTVKKDGEVLYQDQAFGGVLCFVEHLKSFDVKSLEFEGVTQKLTFGHPLVSLFAFDQLRQSYRESPNFKWCTEYLRKIIDNPVESIKLKTFIEGFNKAHGELKKQK